MRPSAFLDSFSFARSVAGALLLASLSGGCVTPGGESEGADRAETAPAAAAVEKARASMCPVGDQARVHEGGSLRRGAANEALYLADEDHDVVRAVPLPLGAGPARAVAVPGGPAQVLPLSGCVLVTVRDPGLLLVLAPDAEAGLREVGRVKVAADAWGIAVTPDERTALVTSAWTHTVTGVDLGTGEVRFAVDVAREPRELIDDNHDRMGRTDALSEEDRAALVAYLETIGTVADEWTGPGDRRPEPVTDEVEVPEIVFASRLPALFVDGSTFAEDPPGEEPTAMPEPREWKGAPEIRLSRDEARCEARRLREWIQVRCPFASLAKLVAGPKEGVSIRAEGEDAVMVFAVRRGERRAFVVEQIERLGRWWLTNDTTWVVSQDWPAGAGAPEVRLLQGIVRTAMP